MSKRPGLIAAKPGENLYSKARRWCLPFHGAVPCVRVSVKMMAAFHGTRSLVLDLGTGAQTGWPQDKTDPHKMNGEAATNSKRRKPCA